jgi:hypothetical protein
MTKKPNPPPVKAKPLPVPSLWEPILESVALDNVPDLVELGDAFILSKERIPNTVRTFLGELFYSGRLVRSAEETQKHASAERGQKYLLTLKIYTKTYAQLEAKDKTQPQKARHVSLHHRAAEETAEKLRAHGINILPNTVRAWVREARK